MGVGALKELPSVFSAPAGKTKDERRKKKDEEKKKKVLKHKQNTWLHLATPGYTWRPQNNKRLSFFTYLHHGTETFPFHPTIHLARNIPNNTCTKYDQNH